MAKWRQFKALNLRCGRGQVSVCNNWKIFICPFALANDIRPSRPLSVRIREKRQKRGKEMEMEKEKAAVGAFAICHSGTCDECVWRVAPTRPRAMLPMVHGPLSTLLLPLPLPLPVPVAIAVPIPIPPFPLPHPWWNAPHDVAYFAALWMMCLLPERKVQKRECECERGLILCTSDKTTLLAVNKVNVENINDFTSFCQGKLSYK